MKTTLNRLALATVLSMVTAPAWAADAGAVSEIGWLGIIFIGFGALVIAFQFIPAVMLFASMLKGFFAAARPTMVPEAEENKS